jgi:hypothetical protein
LALKIVSCNVFTRRDLFAVPRKIISQLITWASFPVAIKGWTGISAVKEKKAVAQFDMRGQRVTNQYNAGRDMNFGAVQTAEDLIAALEQLNGQVTQAQEAGVLNEETATDTQHQVTKAIQQARKPDPDKKTIVDHLTTAKALLDNITAASGLVTALAGAIQIVQKLFS